MPPPRLVSSVCAVALVSITTMNSARADEIDGLSSAAVVTSKESTVDFNGSQSNDTNGFVLAYQRFGPNPVIELQSRYQYSQGTPYRCVNRWLQISAPTGADALSAPSLSPNGTLAVSARINGTWQVYTARRRN